MSSKTVSIIIVSAGRIDFIRPLLDSVTAQDYPVCGTTVIDNSPGHDLGDSLERHYPGVRFFPDKAEASYSRSLNLGLAEARGEFILCLNDDVILENDFLRQAMKGFTADERVGMVSGKILRWDRKTVDSTGLFLSVFRTARERGYGVIDRAQFELPGRIFGVSGALAFYRRKMLDDIAVDGEIFDEDMGFFYEDLDVAWRAGNSGWLGFYAPEARAYHLRGGTARAVCGFNRRFSRRFLTPGLNFELLKNRYLAIVKNDGPFDFIIRLGFISVYELASWGYLLFFQPEVLKLILIGGIPVKSAWRKRRLIRIKLDRGSLMKTRKKSWRRLLAGRSLVVRELFVFLWRNRLWWLIPLVAIFVLLGLLIWLVQSSAVMPFIYTLF